jgi:hypothetical protein
VTDLYGVPQPIPMESPSSWLTRAALSQAVSPVQLTRLFKVRGSVDFDLELTDAVVKRISVICKFNPSIFQFSQHMFGGVSSIDPDGRMLLLKDKDGPLYRYCPVCLKEQSIKHFPVHWRFLSWRYCPLHFCLMEDQCRKCKFKIRLPAHLMNAGKDQGGIAYLHQCLKCDEYLSGHWASVLDAMKRPILTPFEKSILVIGRSVVSAIYHRKFSYEGGDKVFSINFLPNFLSQKFFLQKALKLDAVALDKRIKWKNTQSEFSRWKFEGVDPESMRFYDWDDSDSSSSETRRFHT